MGRCLVHGGRAIKYLVVNSVADYRTIKIYPQIPQTSPKLIGIILIAGGALGLIYGGFSYTKETTGIKVGPMALTVQEKKTVNVPLLVSGGAIVLGVFLLVFGRK